MAQSPRTRRLHADLRAMQQLKSDSTIFDYVAWGSPPETYLWRFVGNGFWRPAESGPVQLRREHEVEVHLRASYPRMQPELLWRTPIFHPNISSSGMVCLGGWGAYWVPSVRLDQLCVMLWDMIRFQNYDVSSPYNREAALWARTQTEYPLPVDPRPLRDRPAGKRLGRRAAVSDPQAGAPEILEAELIERTGPDIMFLQ